MQTGCYGAALVFAVVLVTKAESSVLKPVVPMYCKHLCQETYGCCRFIFTAVDLSCHLITDKSCHNRNDHSQIKTSTVRTCPNDVNVLINGNVNKYHKSPRREGRQRRRKGPIPFHKKPRKRNHTCSSKQCNAKDRKTTEQRIFSCIIFTQKNITFDSDELLTLPLTLKPGMKLTIFGSSAKNVTYSQLTITRNPMDPKNPMEWLHITPTWTSKRMLITEGLVRSNIKGSFPISDKARFSLSLELLSTSAKLYADGMLMKSVKFIPEIKEVYFRRFSKLHRLVFQRTGKGCEKVDTGFP